MLIKEYRIPMPMSVEEYRIAQLYMIQVRIAVSDNTLAQNTPHPSGPGKSDSGEHERRPVCSEARRAAAVLPTRWRSVCPPILFSLIIFNTCTKTPLPLRKKWHSV